MPSNALFAELYQLTMLRTYFELGMSSPSAFSLFVRKLPARRNFLIACGGQEPFWPGLFHSRCKSYS